jgi:hypothetical protein
MEHSIGSSRWRRIWLGATILAAIGAGLTLPGEALAGGDAVEFYARTPNGEGLACAAYAASYSPGAPAEALCTTYGRGREARASVSADGKVVLCRPRGRGRSNPCDLGNVGEGARHLDYGDRASAGPFTCTVLRRGVRCLVRSSGAGFLFGTRTARGVGGAEVDRVHRILPPNPPSFLSPDRRVWCVLGHGSAFCGVGGPQDSGAQRSATISSGGKVSTCYAATPSLTEICLQNWDASAPVLAYGERSQVEGVRCSSAPTGITCVKLTEPGKGRGFQVNKEGVAKIEA